MPIQIQKGPIHLKENGEWIPMPSVFPEKGIDYWTDEDKQEIINEASKKGQPLVTKKLDDYTYVAYYDDIDYDYARHYYEESNDAGSGFGACSSVRAGQWFGRNFDWKYDNNVTFITHTPRVADRCEVWGTAGSLTGLTKEFVESGESSDIYRLIPFNLVDGINEYGLVINNNVVPQSTENQESFPTEITEETLDALMVVRFVLDHFKTADEAVLYLCDHVEVRRNFSLSLQGYALHWMIADANKTYVLEIVDNHFVYEELSYMTNFSVANVTTNSDGTVYTPYTQDETHNAITTNHVENFGSGLERWNIIANAYSTIDSDVAMRSLLNSLKYTNAYTITEAEDVWYTEFVGFEELDVASPASDFAFILTAARQRYDERDRDEANTWQTVHSVVYNINDLTMNIITQEGTNEYDFGIEKRITQAYVNQQIAAAIADVDDLLGSGVID